MKPRISLAQIYGSGNGTIQLRAKTRLEEISRVGAHIGYGEPPYMTNKSSLIERIADLTRRGALEGVADLRDESDRQGMRIVIDLNKNADPEQVLSTLYERTAMHSTFRVNLLALVDGSPHRLTFKQSLRVLAEHRLEVNRRRSEFELRKIKQKVTHLRSLTYRHKEYRLGDPTHS